MFDIYQYTDDLEDIYVESIEDEKVENRLRVLNKIYEEEELLQGFGFYAKKHIDI